MSSSGGFRSGYHGSDRYKRKGLLDKVLGMMESSPRRMHGHPDDRHGMPEHRPGQQHQTGATLTLCVKCSTGLPEGAKFCMECGEKVAREAFCPSCGGKVPAGAKFCPACGGKMNP